MHPRCRRIVYTSSGAQPEVSPRYRAFLVRGCDMNTNLGVVLQMVGTYPTHKWVLTKRGDKGGGIKMDLGTHNHLPRVIVAGCWDRKRQGQPKIHSDNKGRGRSPFVSVK